MDTRVVQALAEMVRERSGPGLVFVDKRDEARALAAALEAELGFEVAWVTAERGNADRATLAERMRTGALRLAVCTSAWSTGLDIPVLQYVVLAGRNKAPIGVLQSVGRALRQHEGKLEFEVLNLSTASTRRQATERAELLGEYGFKLQQEERFLDELAAQPPVEDPPVTWGVIARGFFGPTWAWVSVLILCTIQTLLTMAAE